MPDEARLQDIRAYVEVLRPLHPRELSRLDWNALFLPKVKTRFIELYGDDVPTLDNLFVQHNGHWDEDMLWGVAGAQMVPSSGPPDSLEYQIWFLWMTLEFLDRCTCRICVWLKS